MQAKKGVARWMHALVCMWLNGCFVDTWTKHMAFKCKWVDLGVHLSVLGVLNDKTTLLWMFVFWTTCMQSKNGIKKAFDWVFFKMEFKWDEFQTQAQQMLEVWWP
jgi:hypothetical protein